MFTFQLLLYYLTMKEKFAETLLSDTYIEKMLLQIHGVIGYVFDQQVFRTVGKDVTFNLYTHKNPQVEQILPPNYPSLLRMSYLNPDLKTYIIIHGYTDHKHREIIARLRLVLIESEDANVIVVDWKRLASLIYFNAADNTLPVGIYLGEFLASLESISVDLKKVHLIGHSLGAHVAGIAGAHVGGRVGRITGLDPAGPLFEFLGERGPSESLDKADAMFVDVIHTAVEQFGIVKPVGHVDFYPNEGTVPQPGCSNILTLVSCSHVRSVEFYIESIFDETAFETRHCNATRGSECLKEQPVQMGHHVSPKVKKTIACTAFALSKVMLWIIVTLIRRWRECHKLIVD